LNQVARRRHAGYDAGLGAGTECFLHEAANRRCRGMPQLDQQLAPAAEERAEQSRDGKDDMAV
jgi:hypothetical protein